MKQKTRNSNIELLRILSMFLILLGHIYATRFDSDGQPAVVWYANTLFGTWSILGVDLFVVISAWFFSEQSFSFKRIISVLFQAISYILAFGIYHAVLDCSAGFSIRLFASSFFYFFADNLFFEHHWFVIAYLALCLLFPFLNKLSDCLQKHQMKLLLIVFSVIVFFTNFYGAGYYSVFGNVAHFCFIYLLTVYFKKYSPEIRMGLFCILLPVVFLGSRIVAHFVPDYTWWGNIIRTFLYATVANNRRYSIVMTLFALFLFLIVVRKPARSYAWINAISRHVFGVYLLHETYFTNLRVPYINSNGVVSMRNNFVSLKDIIVDILCKHDLLLPNVLLPLKLFAVAILIFFAGILIEWIRLKLLQEPMMKFITRKFESRFRNIDSHFNF